MDKTWDFIGLNQVQIGLFKHTLLCIKLIMGSSGGRKKITQIKSRHIFLQSLRTADETQHTFLYPQCLLVWLSGPIL